MVKISGATFKGMIESATNGDSKAFQTINSIVYGTEHKNQKEYKITCLSPDTKEGNQNAI